MVTVDSSGKCKDFIRSNEHGFLEGLGWKLDSKRNVIGLPGKNFMF